MWFLMPLIYLLIKYAVTSTMTQVVYVRLVWDKHQIGDLTQRTGTWYPRLDYTDIVELTLLAHEWLHMKSNYASWDSAEESYEPKQTCTLIWNNALESFTTTWNASRWNNNAQQVVSQHSHSIVRIEQAQTNVILATKVCTPLRSNTVV